MNGFLQNNIKSNGYQLNSSVLKYRPVINPPFNNIRPCLWSCCTCMPISRAYCMTPFLENANLIDILKMPYDSNHPRSFNIIKRNLCILHYVATRNVTHHYPIISETDLYSNRLQDAIQKTIAENTIDTKIPKNIIEKSLQTQIKSLVRKMRATISNTLIRFTGIFLHKLLSRLFSSIVVHSGQTKLLQRISLEKKPIVFLPTHRSHLDYILITFILFNLNIHAPHVAAGENLLIPFFGLLMRCLGGFFIRRKLDTEIGKKDFIYRAILQTYIEEVIKQGEFLEIFIEGGRTRSGKALYPKSGLLSVIVQAFNDGIIEDVYIVPVSLSYDKLLDGKFTNELMGLPKKYETFFGTIKAIYKVVTGCYGSARVNFSQPFSLQELISFVSNNTPLCNSSLNSIEKNKSDNSLSYINSDIRPLVDHLALHVIYNSVQTQTIMSTQVLALLLMIKYRKGVIMHILISEFDYLVELINLREHDVGFRGKTLDVINQSLHLLSEKLVSKKYGEEKVEDQCIVEISNEVTNILELSYYSNAALVVFASESVVVNCFFSIVKNHGDAMHKYEAQFDHIIFNSVELCQLLKYEFIFTPPCESLENMMTLALERLQKADLIFPLENLENEEVLILKKHSLRIANSLYNHELANNKQPICDDLDQKIIYTIARKLEDLEILVSFRSMLSPILETYFFVACYFIFLLRQDYLEEEVVKNVHKLILKKYINNEIKYGESVSIDTIRNAIHGFENIGVIASYKLSNVVMIGLTPDYLSLDTLNNLIAQLQTYRN